MYRFEDWRNAFWHTWHLYGFSPLCILPCLTRWCDLANRLRLCTARSWRVLQHLPQSLHFHLSVWIFICVFRPCWDVKRRLHWVHGKRLFPSCILRWSFRLHFQANPLWHTVHKYSLGLSWCGLRVTSLLLSSISASKELSAYSHICTRSSHIQTVEDNIKVNHLQSGLV